MNTKNVLLGMLASIVAGVMVGVYFAKNGFDGRRKILRSGEDLGRALNDTIDKKIEELLTSITDNMKKTRSSSDVNKKEKVGE
jgi:gas vesicle protein